MLNENSRVINKLIVLFQSKIYVQTFLKYTEPSISTKIARAEER